MRRLGIAVLIVGVLMVATASEALCSGNVLFSFGSREVDDGWEPTESHDVFGITAYYEKETWPVSLVFGVYTSDDDGSIEDLSLGTLDVELTFAELSFGVAKVWGQEQITRPYIGGGLTILNVEATVTLRAINQTFEEDDNVVAPYVEGGVFWRIGEAFNIGIGARFVFNADVTIANVEAEGDYTQFQGLIGWGW